MKLNQSQKSATSSQMSCEHHQQHSRHEQQQRHQQQINYHHHHHRHPQPQPQRQHQHFHGQHHQHSSRVHKLRLLQHSQQSQQHNKHQQRHPHRNHQHNHHHHHHHHPNQHPHQHHHHSPPTSLHFWYIIHVILFLIDITSSLTMTEVKIPNHIMRFKSAILGCRYSLDGESLYSVKWYKDGHEIYRYVPRDKPPGQAFPLPGVNIDLRNSSDTQVMLRRVTLQSTGLYRCEVSGEAPAFNTVSESETMTVVVTPNHGPKITGGQPRYQIGDLVRVNCTSAPSKPVCHLSWLINGEPANRSYLKIFDKVVLNRDGLEMARLGLDFRVRPYHFKNGDMKLKCVAKISSLYWQSNEESAESDRQQRAPALESRETVAAKSSTIAAASIAVTTLHTPPLMLLVLLLTISLAAGSISRRRTALSIDSS